MIKTERLLLRQWLPSDFEPSAAMNRDPEVMEFFPKTLTPEETNSMIQKFSQSIEEKGWGFWACSLKTNDQFIGFIGIEDRFVPDVVAPAVEIGWRLLKEHWGNGYATEGAKASLKFGFETLGLNEIVSFTASVNKKSRRVMEKIGMSYEPDKNFEHPKVPEGNPLRKHVLYKIRRKSCLNQ